MLRGAGFAFRHYAATRRMRRRWSRLFAMSSAATPFFLGVCLGAVTAGGIDVRGGISVNGFLAPWAAAFPFLVGALTITLFAFVAALYLVNESDDRALQSDFRMRAISSGVLLAAVAWTAIALAPAGFRDDLLRSRWSWPQQLATGIVAVATFAALYLRRFALARVCGVAQTILILAGWGLAQHPMLIAPRLTIKSAAAPPAVIRLTLIALLLGFIVLAPSFYYLFRVFKGLRISVDRP